MFNNDNERTLLPPNKDWYRDYIDTPANEVHKNESHQFVWTASFGAKILAPLVKKYFRYDPSDRVWYQFDGIKWAETYGIHTVVMAALEDIKRRAGDNGPMQLVVGLSKIHNDKFDESVIRKLERSTTLHVRSSDFDKDINLVNTPDGTYNLLTLEKHPNNPDDLCKKVTAVAPIDDGDGNDCPNYIKHLEFMADGKQKVKQFLEELSGLICSGVTSYQQFYWFYGYRNNGKSVLANVWRYSLGDYACMGNQKQFAERYNSAHPEQEMRLEGVRYVFIDELKGTKLDGAKLKSFTSGSPVVAREMHGNSKEFIPQCKILIASNHKPAADAQDGGLARRL